MMWLFCFKLNGQAPVYTTPDLLTGSWIQAHLGEDGKARSFESDWGSSSLMTITFTADHEFTSLQPDECSGTETRTSCRWQYDAAGNVLTLTGPQREPVSYTISTLDSTTLFLQRAHLPFGDTDPFGEAYLRIKR